MAKKRRAKAAPSSPSTTTAASAASSSAAALASRRIESETPLESTFEVLRQLLEIAGSPARCSDVLDAFSKGNCWTESQAIPAVASSSSSSAATAAVASAAASSPSASTSRSSTGTNQCRPHLDCYWIILATHIINRLLVVDRDTSGKSGTASAAAAKSNEHITYMVALADSVTTILLSDKHKLEKSSHPAGSRSILTRTILSATVVCMLVVEQFVVDGEQEISTATIINSKTQKRQKSGSSRKQLAATATSNVLVPTETLEAAVSTLDRLVHFKGTTQKDTVKLALAHAWTVESFKGQCTRAREMLMGSSMEKEDACAKALLDVSKQNSGSSSSTTTAIAIVDVESSSTSKSTSPPPNKRQARGSRSRAVGDGRRPMPATPSMNVDAGTTAGTSTTAPGSNITAAAAASTAWDPTVVVSSFEVLLASSDFGTSIEGRVAIKRWASIPLVWSIQGDGQLKLLQAMHRLAGVVNEGVITASQLSKLLLQLMGIVSEAGNVCLSRPPTGGIDQYLKSILVTRSEKGKTGSKRKAGTKKKAKVPQTTLNRVDIRDWATVVIYDFLQNHKMCLQEAAETSLHETSSPLRIVNEHIETSGVESLPVYLAPDAGTAISEFCRSASSSGSTNYGKQAESTKVMVSIAVAQSIELIADTSLPLDCKLADFAVVNLLESVRRVEGASSSALATTAGGMRIDYNSRFSLDQILPEPVCPASMGAEPNQECTYAGILSRDLWQTEQLVDQQAVALAVRALQKLDRNQCAPAGAFWTFLINLVRRSYDTRTFRLEQKWVEGNEGSGSAAGDDTTPLAGAKRKRATRGTLVASKQRGGRRRRTELGEVMGEEGRLVWNRMTSSRCSIATETLNALRSFLMKKQQSDWTIREVVRTCLTCDHLKDLVELGSMLDTVLLSCHCMSPVAGGDDDTEGVSSYSSLVVSSPASGVDQNTDFTDSEKALWSSHMNMCKVLGRGQLIFESGRGFDPDVWHLARRLEVYRSLSLPLKGDGATNEYWPLALPSAHQVFLMANMSCIPVSHDKTAERFLASKYTESILHALDNLDDFPVRRTGKFSRFLDVAIPLSYSDARVFMLSLNDISYDEKRHHLEQLIKAAQGAMRSIANCQSKKLALQRNPEASSFLARVIVVIVSLMQSVLSGSNKFKTFFFSNVGSSNLMMPRFVTPGDWNRRDRAFMGLLGDWQSLSLPEAFDSEIGSFVQDKTVDDLKIALEIAFGLGFDSSDRGQLLFTAWNALDQLPRTNPSTEIFDRVPTLQPLVCDFPNRILELREDLCCIHHFLKQGVDGISPAKLKDALHGMVTKASIATEMVLHFSVIDDDSMQQSVPRSVFVFLTAIPAYVAASIACFTKPGNDIFSRALRRSKPPVRRGGQISSESEALSDGDSSLEADDYEIDNRVGVLNRLRECCDAFGAAPTHPDWLDASCTLRDGIEFNDIVEMAETAMQSLSRLISVSMLQFKKQQALALKVLCSEGSNADRRANFCGSLLPWSSNESGRSILYEFQRGWIEDVATAAEIPTAVLEFMVEQRGIRDVEGIKEAWCPCSAQRLRGHLQEGKRLGGDWKDSVKSLRAGGEWELLLSEALATSCLKTDSSMDGVVDDEIQELIVTAQLWKMVTNSAVRHMAPVAALLRMGIGKAGRSPHPFCDQDNSEDPYVAVPIHLIERPNADQATSSASATINDALTLLARVSVEAEESIGYTCHTIAAQLVIDTDTFTDFASMYSIRCALIGLQRLQELAEGSSKKKRKKGHGADVVPYMAERLLSVIQEFGQGTGTTTKVGNRYPRLSSFLSNSGTLVETLAGTLVDSRSLFEQGIWTEYNDESYHWLSKNRQSLAIAQLISFLFDDSLGATNTSRSIIAQMMSHVAKDEFYKVKGTSSTDAIKSVIIPSLISAFNAIEKSRFKAAVLEDLSSGQSIGEDLGTVLSLLLSMPGREVIRFEKARDVLELLMKIPWRNVEKPLDLLTVVLTYGTRYERLLELGSALIERATTGGAKSGDNTTVEAALLSSYFTSLKQLKVAVQTGSNRTGAVKKEPSKKDPTRNTESIDSALSRVNDFPKSCSFVHRSGFHNQHWYYCYTCNLSDDKGCCLLCALVCHKGHDVAYSRFSSFFCDCGAEDGGAAELGRVTCKCLGALPECQIASIVEEEQVGRLAQLPSKEKEVECNVRGSVPPSPLPSAHSLPIDIATSSFREIASSAVSKFSSGLNDVPLLESLFTVLDCEFNSWKRLNGESMLRQLVNRPSSIEESTTAYRVSFDSARKSLRTRHSRVLDLARLTAKTFSPVRAVRGIQAKYADSSTHVLIAKRLSRLGCSRSIMVVDSRGRMIVAESSSLVFFTPYPAVNVQFASAPAQEVLPRQRLSIFGTARLAFTVVGLRLCPDNERHLAAFGTSEACIVVLNSTMSDIELTVSLGFDMSNQEGESDCILKCEWLPGSQSHIVLCSPKSLCLYDVSSGRKQVNALYEYHIGCEKALRSVCVVPRIGQSSRIFLQLDHGRIHALDVDLSNGKLEAPEELRLESSDCILIPMSGIRTRAGSSGAAPGTNVRTLGEGSQITYLKQSRVLLYKCKSAPVVAILLGPEADVEGTFELLPNTVSGEVLLADSTASSVCGPYSHWTELGVVYRSSGTFFRVACVGRSMRSEQPTILCIEFNETDVRVQPFTRGLGASVFDIETTASCEGMTAFTAPKILEPNESNGRRYMSSERTFLSAVTSAGNVLFFGEDIVDAVELPMTNMPLPFEPFSVLSNVGAISKQPEFPLSIFEQLTNISDSDELHFIGEGLLVNPLDLKVSLSRESSSHFASPRRDGCSLILTLKGKATQNSPTLGSATNPSQDHCSDLVIAAVRILVGSGSTFEYTPTHVCVNGRRIEVKPRSKRWLNVPLTKEEISLGIRNGCVCIFIGTAYDPTNRPIVDAVEVYAMPRESVNFVSKTYYTTVDVNTQLMSQQTSLPKDGLSNTLGLSVRALINLTELMNPSNAKMTAESATVLGTVIEETVLHPDKTLFRMLRRLSESLDPDSKMRWSDSALKGCARALDECQDMLRNTSVSSDDLTAPKNMGKSIRSVVHECIQAALAIATERPVNYLQSMGGTPGSIAVKATKLVAQGLQQSRNFEGMLASMVTLLLTEIAIDSNLVQISSLQAFLDSDAKRCCGAISAFFSGEHGVKIIEQLEAARLVAYQCDGCAVCPMTEVRYTLPSDVYFECDLCRDCFAAGQQFAQTKKFSKSTPVIINGKTVEADGARLMCVHMKEMQACFLDGGMVLEQVNDSVNHEEAELRKAMRMSLSQDSADDAGCKGYEDLCRLVFDFLLEKFCDSSNSSNIGPLLSVLINLINQSKRESWRKERASSFAASIATGMTKFMRKEDQASLAVCLQSLCSLLTVDKAFAEIVKACMWKTSATGNLPPHVLLCQFVKEKIAKLQEGNDEYGFAENSHLSKDDKKSQEVMIQSQFCVEDMQKAYNDGVYCSKEKLQDVTSAEALIKAELEISDDLRRTPGNRNSVLLHVALDLLVQVADHSTDQIGVWFSMLCYINMSSDSHVFNSLAVKAMKALCGNLRHLYHDVRDHFAFLSHLERLYQLVAPLLAAAMIVKEKARMCTLDWSTSKKVEWSTLQAGDLIGTSHLISEDVVSEQTKRKIDMILDSLLKIAVKRGSSWRRFCGLGSLSSSSHRSGRPELPLEEHHLSNTPAILALFWIACAASGGTQVKTVRILDVALVDVGSRGDRQESTSPVLAGGSNSKPEDILSQHLNENDIVATATSLIVGGKTPELRGSVSRIVVKICKSLSNEELWTVVQSLIAAIEDVALLGRGSVEFLTMLSTLLLQSSELQAFPIKDSASIVEGCFLHQLEAIKFGRENGKWDVLDLGTGNTTTKRRFDLSNCPCCIQHSLSAEQRSRKASTKSATAPSSATARAAPSDYKWHPDQVCHFTRSKLDSGRDSTTSNDFCQFFKLKYRQAITEINLTVNDARGRYVKTLNVYFTPRPVRDVAELKSDGYAKKWQHCATLTLPKGSGRASASLAVKVVAANIKVEFSEFYERPGERNEDGSGSLIIHCPRCQSVVRNAHGVCHACGEVAFQCRKCRHINYDRLDAFFCVECGYCPMGTFSIDVLSGVATNAIAISNDKDYDRAIKMHGTATSILEKIKVVLGEKLREIVGRTKALEQREMEGFFPPEMQEAFRGLPPGTKEASSIFTRYDKPGSVVKAVARPDSHGSRSSSSNARASSRTASAEDPTQAFLRLARQLRAEYASTGDGSRSADAIIRQLGRGLSGSTNDDEGGILGLLESGSILDSPAASRRAAAADTSSQNATSTLTAADTSASTGMAQELIQSRKKEGDDCQKLLVLMREASRECYELERRIDAWNGLESGRLVESTSLEAIGDGFSFAPCECSVCSPTVALQLLMLWWNLFLVSPATVEIDDAMLDALLEDIPGQSSGLGDCKKRVAVSIATNSERGAQLALEKLKRRLGSYHQDKTCAEVLGQILEADNFSMKDEYSQFAVDILSAN